MSGANDLLNNLTEEEMAEYSGGKVMVGVEDDVLYMTSASYDPTEEPHIVIGTDRHIIVPEILKRIAVQFDHNIETVTFDCPRFWDGHDMSQMRIYINYKNGTNEGSYLVENVMIESDIMHFDWVISRGVTQFKGPVTFLVCVKKTNDEGIEENHWNSELNKEMYVSEGMECEEEYWDEYPDLLNQLLARQDRIDAIGATTEEAVSNYFENHSVVFQGPQGPQGEPGKNGEPGKSAFEYAQEGGYTGTEAEFTTKLSEETIKGTSLVNGTSVDVTAFDYFTIRTWSYDSSTPPVLNGKETHLLDHVVYNARSNKLEAYGSYHTGTGSSYKTYRLTFVKSDSTWNVTASYMVTGEANWSTVGNCTITGFKRSY